MNDVSVISPLPVQILDPVTDGSMDELKDTLVPVQEEDLPQGVLDLLAALVLRHRSMTILQGAADVVRDKALPAVPMTMTHPQAKRPTQQLPPQLMATKGLTFDRIEMSAQVTLGEIEPDLRPSNLPVGSPIERSPNIAEPMSIERAASAQAPILLTTEAELPEALLQPPVMRHTVAVVPPSIPASPILRPVTAPEVMLETPPVSDRGLLQVPFNKGTVSGQVTISRVPDEPARNLQLSPSNALVFEQLKEPFEQVREPTWRLTDSGGEQQRQGSHQSPDDEQDEQFELPA
ncbi:SpaN/EivJ family type III secretion system needle length determinant [Pseudomonas azerbaijanoccidentalis]